MPEMHDTYRRLLQAARELRGWKDAAEVARELTKAGYNASDQTMTNWKSRGISAKGCLFAATHIGCRHEWLLNSTGPMTDPMPRKSENGGDLHDFMTKAITDVVAIMRTLNNYRQQQILSHAKYLSHEQQLDQNSDPRSNSGNDAR